MKIAHQLMCSGRALRAAITRLNCIRRWEGMLGTVFAWCMSSQTNRRGSERLTHFPCGASTPGIVKNRILNNPSSGGSRSWPSRVYPPPMAEKTTWAYTPKRQGDRVALPHGQSHDSSFHLTVAAAHQHDPTTQRLGLPAPGASRRGSPVRSLEGQNPNLENSVIDWGRSKRDRRSEGGSDRHLRIDSGSWREAIAPGCYTT